MKALIIFLLNISFAFAETYLSEKDIDLSDFPAPPANLSIEDTADLEAVIKWQEIRSANDCKRASVESEGFATSFFGPPYGPLSQEEAQKLVHIQEKIFAEIKFFSKIIKNKWTRKRPFERNVLIKPCIPIITTSAYPSGHAAVAFVSARFFSMLYPENEKYFLKRAEEIALDRVVGGVHHPKDIEAGKILGKKIFEALKVNKEFIKDLKVLTP